MSPSLFLLCLCVSSLTEANLHSPRMVFRDHASDFKRFALPGGFTPVQILLEEQSDAVASVGGTHLNFYNFTDPKENPVEKKVVWEGCTSQDCSYNISMVHQSTLGGPVFVCGADVKISKCCYMNLSEHSPECFLSEKLKHIKVSWELAVKEDEHSVLVETEQSTDLYMTYSGAQEIVGIYKFGEKCVRPAQHDKEQHYVGLVLNRRRNDALQNRIYAFYRQKNKDTGLGGHMWLPYVSQVCTADVGGPKNNLQFSWTSQMSARLFCGDPNTKQDFTELVDVATVHADRWQDTKIYALFRNEWGMSAVCVYTIGGISNVFMTSPFKESTADDNMRKECVGSSDKLNADVLRRIKMMSEVREWVRPVNKLGPILVKHHNYTRISVDAFPHAENDVHAVVFLSLSDGRIHQAVHTDYHSVIIAEYQPFRTESHIISLKLDASSKKLYVSSRSELVQINLADCSRYGNTCEECVLSRNPYCGWSRTGCTARGDVQDVVRGNHTVCSRESSSLPHVHKVFRINLPVNNNTVMLPSGSKYFLSCPMSSHHAQYTWHHPGGIMTCSSMEEQCHLLINNMTDDQQGDYRCESEEMGYRRVLEQYRLQVRSTSAAQTLAPTVWVCVLAVLVKSFYFYF